MKKLIPLLVLTSMILTACSSKEKEPEAIALETVEAFTTHTFYIKWSGDESRKKETLEDLSEKKCWTLREVVPESRVLSSDCHEFSEYKNKSDIHGAFKKVGSGYMIQVKVDKNDVYNVQIFEQIGKKMKRAMKPAKYIDPDDFAVTLKRLTFK
jgi:hypothetical protein